MKKTKLTLLAYRAFSFIFTAVGTSKNSRTEGFLFIFRSNDSKCHRYYAISHTAIYNIYYIM